MNLRTRVSRGLARADAVGARVLDLFPLTPLGLLVVAAGGATLRWLAYPSMDLVLVLIGVSILGLAATSVLLVTLGALRLRFASRGLRGPDERTLETARSLPTGFRLPGLLLVPFTHVWWSWERPSASVELRREGLRLAEDAALVERGFVRGVVRRVVVQDVFGLARLAIRHTDPGALTVLPHVGALREVPVLVSLSGGDDLPHPMGLDEGDRVELRRYAPGDPARFIHWKVFGRTRKLVVRVPERALTRSRRAIAYLVAGPADEASAAAARVALEAGTLGPDWVFGADGSAGETSEVADAVARVVRSAEARDDGARGLASFIARAERLGPASLVVFVPPEPGPWLERVVPVLASRGARAKAVVAIDALAPSPSSSRLARWLWRPAPQVGTDAASLDAVVRALSATRAEVVVVDRVSGRRLGDAQRRAMQRPGREVAA